MSSVEFCFLHVSANDEASLLASQPKTANAGKTLEQTTILFDYSTPCSSTIYSTGQHDARILDSGLYLAQEGDSLTAINQPMVVAIGRSKIPCMPRMALCGGLMMGVPSSDPNTPPFEMVKVPPSMSSTANVPFFALSASPAMASSISA
uniref:Uncharacterized protein n=1 Tax=Anopheles merus TaxID=30066 RepID=A0A182V5F4_ANOME